MEVSTINMEMDRGPSAFDNPKQLYQPIPPAAYEVASFIESIDTLINDFTLWDQFYKQV